MARQIFIWIYYMAFTFVRHIACRTALRQKERISLERIWTALTAGRHLVMRDTKLDPRFAVPNALSDQLVPPKRTEKRRNLVPKIYQLDTLHSAFRLLVACCRATKSSAESDGLQIRNRSAGFKRSNRRPLLGILKFWVAWTIFAPQM